MEPRVQAILDQVKDLLASRDLVHIRELFSEEHPADVAGVIMALDDDERQELIQEFNLPRIAEVFNYLDARDAADILKTMPVETTAATLDEIDPDAAVDVLGEFDKDQANLVLSLMQKAEQLAPLRLHDEESAGGVMTPHYLSLDAKLTVWDALAFLRKNQPSSEIAYYIFVVDSQNHLRGVVSLRDLVVAPPETRLEAIMNPEVVTVQAGTDQEEAARLMRHYDLLALPVVDGDGKLIGTITFDDAADVLEEETTEDIYHMVGLSEDERVLAPLWSRLRRRVPWLLVNLCTAFFSASVVSLFEPSIQRMSALAVFMPVVAGHGGNTGTQAITLVVRALALGEIRPSDTWEILYKEVTFGIIHGIVAGLAAATIALVLVGNLWLGIVVAAAMMGNVVIAVIMGALLPMFMRALHLDPALMSSIFLTTFTDTIGFLLLLGIGTIFMVRLLGG